MHANPGEVTFVVLKNRKKFNVLPGSFHADETSMTFDYTLDNRERRRITVDRTFVAAVESVIP